jgi:hypothetical protein
MIFGDRPGPAATEAELAAILALEERQQRRAIAQIERARDLLTAAQRRAKLADELLRQAPPSGVAAQRR